MHHVCINVTMRRVLATIVAVESRKYYVFGVCVCSVSYPPCNAHAPYCHLWPVRLCLIFPHYLINGTIFEKESYWTQRVFWFSLQLLSGAFLILRRLERDMIKNVYWPTCKVPFFLPNFNETRIFSTEFQKNSNIKFHENLSIKSRVIPCGQTDIQTDMAKLIVALRNFGNVPKTR
jgi:hypothetical protein